MYIQIVLLQPFVMWMDHKNRPSRPTNDSNLVQARLCPLPSTHPWPSVVALYVVSGLPPSKGKIAILTVVDNFSKLAHFIALPKSPSARKIADILVDHVFFTFMIWHSFRQGSSIHLSGLEGLLHSSGSHCQLPFWITSSEQWAEGEGKPTDGGHAPLYLFYPFLLLESPVAMGGICPQHPHYLLFGVVPFFVDYQPHVSCPGTWTGTEPVDS